MKRLACGFVEDSGAQCSRDAEVETWHGSASGDPYDCSHFCESHADAVVSDSRRPLTESEHAEYGREVSA